MNVNNIRLLFVSLCWVMSAALNAEIYEWVDDNNRKHYTQIPPADKSKIIRVIGDSGSTATAKQGNRSAKEAADSAKAYSDYLQSERLERKEKREEKKRQLAELRKHCNRMRAELSDYEQGGVIYYELDEKGERVFWSDERLDEEITRLRERIQSDC